MFEQLESFTFFPSQYWSHTWERQHEIIFRFAQEIAKDVYIFPPLGLVSYNLTSIAFIKRVVNKFKRQRSSYNRSSVQPNMRFVRSLYIHRFDHLSTQFNYRYLSTKVRVSSSNFFWSAYMNPTVYEFFKRSKFKVLDLAERRQANTMLSDEIRELERVAVAQADLVIVDNQATYSDYSSLTNKIHYLPQGYDSRRIYRNTGIMPGKKIGYIGNLHFQVDYDYLVKLIEENPDREFLIVGAVVDKTANKLRAFDNVQMVGQVSKEDLQTYLEEMEYGLIPYKINDFTAGVFPTKLFEYLGAGVPVISTAIPEVVQFDRLPFVFVEPTPKPIRLQTNLDGLENFLAHHTWDARFSRYTKLVSEAMS